MREVKGDACMWRREEISAHTATKVIADSAQFDQGGVRRHFNVEAHELREAGYMILMTADVFPPIDGQTRFIEKLPMHDSKAAEAAAEAFVDSITTMHKASMGRQ